MNKRVTGTKYENKSIEYLEGLGFDIVYRNFRCKAGEIDIIACDKEELVFIEVKFRAGKLYGNAIEAVTPSKQQTIRKVAAYYMATVLHKDNIPCRFDVIGFDGDKITHIRNAF